eukprot:CAMPEP_0179100394 /NCGR_PEP_ID=MMETSP0796-20121207/46364_1 /TAXON_ID=73915 /ORGANISM="Pyrodinium bahamense, Strain pbaha01" /LENGTH=481 /DNA_ID=CAMNT_0020798217 /DNA_START=88 /DNA_END=1534 /DNA_ORIENTATION=+
MIRTPMRLAVRAVSYASMIQPLLRLSECGDGMAMVPDELFSTEMQCATGQCWAEREEDEEQAFIQTVRPGRRESLKVVDSPGGHAPKAQKAVPLETGIEGEVLSGVRGGGQSQRQSGPSELSAIENVNGGAAATDQAPQIVKQSVAKQAHLLPSGSGTGAANTAVDATVAEGPWRGTSLVSAALETMSILALLGTGLYLRFRSRHNTQEADTTYSPGQSLPPPKIPSKEVADCPKLAAQVQAAIPLPMPRLPHVGTSFVVPLGHIMQCCQCSLTIDVPVSPAVWPLRAAFSRAAAGSGPWARLDLSIDLLDAAGLPPLLSCSPPVATAAAAGSGGAAMAEHLGEGGSGGTGAPEDVAIGTGARARAWLEVRGGNGALAAMLMAEPGGGCTVQRHGHTPWEVHIRESQYGEHWVVAQRRGQDLGLATRLRHSKLAPEEQTGEEYFQIDTQPDTSSPESVLLLISILAVMVFKPVGLNAGDQQ